MDDEEFDAERVRFEHTLRLFFQDEAKNIDDFILHNKDCFPKDMICDAKEMGYKFYDFVCKRKVEYPFLYKALNGETKKKNEAER